MVRICIEVAEMLDPDTLCSTAFQFDSYLTLLRSPVGALSAQCIIDLAGILLLCSFWLCSFRLVKLENFVFAYLQKRALRH